LEASAHYVNKDPEAARRILQAAIKEHEDSPQFISTAVNVYSLYGDHTNAMSALNRLLELQPDNASAYISKGYVLMQFNQVEDAIASFSRALELDPNAHRARFNRAIAYLRIEQLDKARQDYDYLEILFPNLYQVQYGLGEIAWRQRDTPAAIAHYQNYLTNAPPHTAEAKTVVSRLQELQTGRTN
jgi:tetratricopeptide (TPR) repeat protein